MNFWQNCTVAGACEVAYQIGRLTMYRSLKQAGKLRENAGGKLGRRIRRNPNYTGASGRPGGGGR